MTTVIIPAFIVVLLIVILQVFSFNKTTYHSATGNSYFATIADTGKYGEYRIFKQLKYLEKQGAKFLFNVYLPKENGETTECDVILILPQGFIVFESKNYSGWIFGDEKSKTWTQTLPQGKGRAAHKEKFFNPIMQNNLHIKYLKTVIGDNYAIQSIIVFSERCTLKKISVSSKDVQVVKRNNIVSALTEAIHMMPQDAVPDEEIMRLYELLYPYSQVSDSIKQKHIQNIRNKHNKEG